MDFLELTASHECIQKALKKPLYYGSATALLQLYHRPYIVAHTIVRTNGSTSSLQTALQTALRTALQRPCNGSATALQRLYNGSTNGFTTAQQMVLQRLYKWLYDGFINGFAWLCNSFINSSAT